MKKRGEQQKVEIGIRAPDFTLQTDKGEDWRLSEQSGKIVTLLFYPKNETLVCTKQLCSVRDNWTDYLETKTVIVAISPGTIKEHQRFIYQHRLPLPILADPDRKITKLYTSRWLLPVSFTRAVFVIDAKGIIRNREIMFRIFRPTDKKVLASIIAAKKDWIYQNYIHA